jgi:hypothetical protein
MNSFWHMPFRKHARVEVWNQSSGRMTVYCQVNWIQLPSVPEDVLYFHARYHQESPVKPFSAYTIFEGQGEGHYVGTVLSSQNSFGVWFGEADGRFYIDDEPTPSLVGTGTEDYFTDGWNLRLFSNPNAGVTTGVGGLNLAQVVGSLVACALVLGSFRGFFLAGREGCC